MNKHVTSNMSVRICIIQLVARCIKISFCPWGGGGGDSPNFKPVGMYSSFSRSMAFTDSCLF